MLTDSELRAIWSAAADDGYPFKQIVQLLLLTGQRREEVAGMRWEEIANDYATWNILGSRTKNGQSHVVPLSDAARLIIENAPQTSELVFPGERGTPFSGWSKAKSRLDGKSRVTGWRLHDLRRTFATGMQKLGVRLEVTESILNHVAGSRAGIVGIYQRHDWKAEKRVSLNAWAEHVMAVVENRPQRSNILQIAAHP